MMKPFTCLYLNKLYTIDFEANQKLVERNFLRSVVPNLCGVRGV